MRETTLLFLIVGLLVVLTGGAPAAEPEKKATKAPAKDICKDCVDPYNQSAERARFFRAAGVDNELDAGEYEKDKARTNGFIRAFDTWAGMTAFDKDANKKIDWFEADSYRRNVRKRVLSVFDTSKDGRLKDTEREAANRALATGKIPSASEATTKGSTVILGGGAGKTQPGQSRVIGGGYAPGQMSEQARLRMFDKDRNGKLDDDETAAMTTWQADAKTRREQWARQSARYRQLYAELVKKHDTNGNGRIDADERKAYYEEYRQRSQIVRWDTDGDGQLSAAEKKAQETQQAEWKKRAEESRHKWMLQRWDKDKDGQMSAEETAAMEANQAEMKKRAEQYRKAQAELRDKHDTDGDGQLNATERQAYYDTLREQSQLRRWDKNTDGTLDETERKTMADEQAKWRKRSEEYRRQWELRRYDKNKDNQLDEAERKTMEQERAKWRQPGNVTINGRPIQMGTGQGGVRVWNSRDGTGRSIIIKRSDAQDE